QARRALRAERAASEQREAAHRARVSEAAAKHAAELEQQRSEKIRWARETALPEIGRLRGALDIIGAFKLAAEVQKYLPDDPGFLDAWPRVSFRASIDTIPSGARIYVKPYRNPSA